MWSEALASACNHNGLEKDSSKKGVRATIMNGLKKGAGDPLRELRDRPMPGDARSGKSSGKGSNGAEPSADAEPPEQEHGNDPRPSGNLPVIKITGGSLSDNADDVEHYLRVADVQIYRQGGKLVRPVRIKLRDCMGEEIQVPAVTEVTATFLRDVCCRLIEWKKWDARKPGNDKWVKTTPSKEIADVILDRLGENDKYWRTLKGVTNTPFLRRDGSIAYKPGFDDATGMFLMDPVELPADMPEQPTKADAMLALDTLEELLLDFPFVDPDQEDTKEAMATDSASVGLSMLLTPQARPAVECAPMHLGRAPVAGTGKSYLFNLVSAIFQGTKCPVMAAGKDEEETEKRLGSEILAGVILIVIDNANGVLGGDLICQVISQPIVKPRILGKSKTPQITNVFVMFANGNNISVRGDLARRTLWCVLDRKLDAAEVQEWEFQRDPVNVVLANRGKYVAACLTILRAHALARYPGAKGLKPFNGFDDWSRVVRGALVWLGKADPVATVAIGRNDDPQRNDRQAFAEALYDMSVTSEYDALTAAQIAEKATEKTSELKPLRPALNEAVMQFMDGRGVVNTLKLGQWLPRIKDEVFGIKYLAQAKERARGNKPRWYVLEILKK